MTLNSKTFTVGNCIGKYNCIDNGILVDTIFGKCAISSIIGNDKAYNSEQWNHLPIENSLDISTMFGGLPFLDGMRITINFENPVII